MAAKPKRQANDESDAKPQSAPSQGAPDGSQPAVSPHTEGPVSYASSQPGVKVVKAQAHVPQTRVPIARPQAGQPRPQAKVQRQVQNMAAGARQVQNVAVGPRPAQPAPLPVRVVAAPTPVSELVQTIQSPMGPLQIVTKQVNGKMVQLIRFNKFEPKGPTNLKRLLLAAIPGFFGVMGLSQIYQGKKVKGAIFFAAGLIASFVSSWYLIVPARVDALFTHAAIQSPYSISFLSSLNIDPSLASKLSVDLLGVVAVVWALQLFDAMGPFFSKESIVSMAPTTVTKMPLPLPLPSPGARRAITPATIQNFNRAEAKPAA